MSGLAAAKQRATTAAERMAGDDHAVQAEFVAEQLKVAGQFFGGIFAVRAAGIARGPRWSGRGKRCSRRADGRWCPATSGPVARRRMQEGPGWVRFRRGGSSGCRGPGLRVMSCAGMSMALSRWDFAAASGGRGEDCQTLGQSREGKEVRGFAPNPHQGATLLGTINWVGGQEGATVAHQPPSSPSCPPTQSRDQRAAGPLRVRAEPGLACFQLIARLDRGRRGVLRPCGHSGGTTMREIGHFIGGQVRCRHQRQVRGRVQPGLGRSDRQGGDGRCLGGGQGGGSGERGLAGLGRHPAAAPRSGHVQAEGPAGARPAGRCPRSSPANMARCCRTPTARCSAGWRWSSSPAASRIC